MKEVIQFLNSGSWQGDAVLAVIILVLLALVLMLVISLVLGREVSFWPPKIGPRIADAGPVRSSPVDSVIAKVRSPRSGASVDHPPRHGTYVFPVEGTFEKLPD